MSRHSLSIRAAVAIVVSAGILSLQVADATGQRRGGGARSAGGGGGRQLSGASVRQSRTMSQPRTQQAGTSTRQSGTRQAGGQQPAQGGGLTAQRDAQGRVQGQTREAQG